MKHEMEIKILRKSEEKGYVKRAVYVIDNPYISDIVLGVLSSINEIKMTSNCVITERCSDDR